MTNDDRSTLAAIEALLARHIGFDPQSLGINSLTKIILQMCEASGFPDLEAYWLYLNCSPETLEELVEAVVVPETSFFRHPKSFIYLRHHVCQHPQPSWRILSLPCSTGEEPYSIAMTLLEAGLPAETFSIDAVDVSDRALTKARQGVYTPYSFRQINKLPSLLQQTCLKSYFQERENQYLLGPQARSSVRFHRGNLANIWCLIDFLPYDIIFCRNLLIYFHASARDRALHHLDRLLVPDGLLFVGHAEGRLIDPKRFRPIDAPQAFVYRKLSSADKQERSSNDLPQPSPPLQIHPEILPYSPIRESKRAIAQTGSVRTVKSRSRPQANSSDRPQLNLSWIRTLADRGLLAEALDRCQDYLTVHPTDAAAYLLYGQIEQARGHDERAERTFQKVLFLNPRCKIALTHLLLLQRQKGDSVGADRFERRLKRLSSKQERREEI